MQDDETGRIRAVAWSQVFPWLILARCFRIAVSFRLLVLSALGTVTMLTGWALLAWMFSSDAQIDRQLKACQGCPWRAAVDLVPDSPPLFDAATGAFAQAGRAEQLALSFGPGAAPERTAPGNLREMLQQPPSVLQQKPLPFWGSWLQLGRPFAEMFHGDVTVVRLAFLLLCGLWGVAVWALFGACITRVVAVRLAAGERLGWMPMLRHAVSKWPSYVFAPLFPLLLVLLAGIFVGVTGLLLFSADWTVVLAAILWPLVLLAGLVMAILLLGLIFGWPLMWSTIGVEGTDSFDALSRSYGYVFQRPLHYLFYAAVAIGLGALGWLLVENFAAAVVGLTYGAAGWGSGASRAELIAAAGSELNAAGRIGACGIRFWVGCVKLLAVGFLFSYFWTASTAIYFLLRRSVDATEMDEVYLEEDQQTYSLPPVRSDAAGAPVVEEGGSAAE